MTVTSPDRPGLGAIAEDEETQEEMSDSDEKAMEKYEKKEYTPPEISHGDDVFEVPSNKHGLSEEELLVLSKWTRKTVRLSNKDITLSTF